MMAGRNDKSVHVQALHKAQLIGFGLHPSHDHLARTVGQLHMSGLGCRLKARAHEVDKPPDTDTNDPAHPIQRDVLQQ